jgi:hypothetical protein
MQKLFSFFEEIYKYFKVLFALLRKLGLHIEMVTNPIIERVMAVSDTINYRVFNYVNS